MNDLKSQTVILLDDDEDDRFLFQQAFQPYAETYLLQTVENALLLDQQLNESLPLPALLVLDLNMPLFSGFDVLIRLRAHSGYRSMPIVILTTSDTKIDRERALELGGNEFLTKPQTLEQLTQLVDRLVQKWLVEK